MKLSHNIRIFKKQKSALGDDMPRVVKAVAYLCTTLFSLVCILPVFFALSISFTEEKSLAVSGYHLIPQKFSLNAYEYVFKDADLIFRSYGVTIAVTVLGTLLGLFVMSMFAYAVTREKFPWKFQFSFYVYFTMLFSGGMVASYIVVSNILHLKDNFLVLILPCCYSAMYLIIMRTYMRTSIPPSVVESARIDGASEFTCYAQIVLPMSVPVLTTIALFLAIAYWNNWFTSFLYVVNNNKIIPLQLLLKRIENDVEFLSSASNGMSTAEVEEMRESLPSESFKMALVMMIITPMLIAYPFFQKFIVKGITVGAVKG